MNEIIAAAIGAGVSLLVSAIVSIREGSKAFSDKVSSERMAWVKEVRELAATMISICEQYEPDELTEEQYAAFLNARNGILVRLNPIDDEYYANDHALQCLLDDPNFASTKKNIPVIRYWICTIMKEEWDKFKIESGNSIFKRRKLDTVRKKLEKYKDKTS